MLAITDMQAGAISRAQAYDVGATAKLLARRVAAGTLLPLGCDVFAAAGSTDSLARKRWTALLAAGTDARLTHETSADLYQIEGVRRGLTVVTVRHPLHLEIPNATIHQLNDLQPQHLATVRGWPTTTPARTIVDLAAGLSWIRLATALEYVVAERLASFTGIRDVLSDVRRRGKGGVRNLLTVLEARGGEPPPASELERKLHRVGELSGLPIIRQHPLPWAREPIEGIVDGAILESRLILEGDGRKWHARFQAMAKDRLRDRTAARAGWQTLRWVWEDFADLSGVAAELREIHDSRVSATRIPSA